MPKFYFDLVTSEGGRITDQEGLEFADLEAAKSDALHSLGAMGNEEIADHESAHLRIEIRNEGRSIVCQVSLEAGANC